MRSAQKLKILLAEDDDDLREIVSLHLLETFDVEISITANGAEAIEKLKSEESFDLIISDFLMPILNGKNVLEFNVSHQNLPFIMMTATEVKSDQTLSRIDSFNSLNRLFMKPFSIDEFCNHINSILRSTGKL